MVAMATPLAARSLNLVATCSLGLEEVVARELLALGVRQVAPGRGVVRFEGTLATVCRAVLWLRAAMRVMVRLAGGRAVDRRSLYDLAVDVTWEEWFAPEVSFAVDVAGRSRAFANSAFAALVVKDAIVDRLRARWGTRPDVDRRSPDLRVHLHLGEGVAELSLDGAGEPLSHRGYRPRGGPAPLAESLAAGILLLAGYDGGVPLVDPMCGTGTIAIEGALIATNTAPGLHRRFACERWACHDPEQLGRLRDEARGLVRGARAPVIARDADPRAVAATRRNAAEAGLTGVIAAEQGDIDTLAVPGPGTIVVMNPPYGQRLGSAAALPALYRRIGDALKRGAVGCTAWLLAGDRELAKQVGLRADGKVRLFNGPIECRLLRFDLYAGSRGVATGRSRSPSP
jgi:putative N6-adenine-specific DNA methylase